MIAALALWRRLPVVVRAVAAGWLVTTVGTGLWVLLSLANQKYFPGLPWAMLPTAGYLWLFWHMQGPIERRHGPIVAILITGVMFGFGHFAHPEVTVVLMPYYVAVAAVYGGLAYITNAILPSLALHAGGNMFVFLGQFGAGQSEWQATAAPLVWQTGPDATFVVTVAAAILLGAAVFWAYSGLAAVMRAEQADQGWIRS